MSEERCINLKLVNCTLVLVGWFVIEIKRLRLYYHRLDWLEAMAVVGGDRMEISDQVVLTNQLVMIKAIGLILHHVGHLQDLVGGVPKSDWLASSDERATLLEELIERKDITETFLAQNK